jgi:hypothetical protein
MSLALRSISPAWKCVPSVASNGGVPWHDDAPNSGRGPVHSLRIGAARVSLDLWSGVGYEIDHAQGVLRRLSPAEGRLVLLDWTRSRMPASAPTALWALEAAALAGEGSGPHWQEWASVDLQSALDSLRHSPIEWTAQVQRSLTTPSEDVTPEALGAILQEVEAWVASRTEHSVDSMPAPLAVEGCSEVEWDGLGGFGIDIGELGLRSRMLGTVWTASVASAGHRRDDESGRLWARLVDEHSGSVYDEVEMRLVDGVWSARGYVSPRARHAGTRIDLTTDLERLPRTRDARTESLVEQTWFRILHFDRRRSANASWGMWSESYRERLALETVQREPSLSRPFLAERHLQPTDLASGRPLALSPEPASDAPGTL